jgi:ubiquinone/menaquinone biosynthesis C-methylase UbiE
MSEHRVDYDRLSSTYNARYQANSLQEIGEAIAQLARGRVLEVGCGTGRWLADVSPVANFVVGVDASFGMLKQYRGEVPLVNARANSLPFRENSFDFVFCVNALHHFADKMGFIRDAAALLMPGGTFAVLGMDPRTIRTRYIYDYFETTRANDLERYPSFGEIVDWMSASGLDSVEHRIIHTWTSCLRGLDVLNDPFLPQGSNSTLALLSDEQYRTGLARIRTAAVDSDAVFATALPFGMTLGRRNS